MTDHQDNDKADTVWAALFLHHHQPDTHYSTGKFKCWLFFQFYYYVISLLCVYWRMKMLHGKGSQQSSKLDFVQIVDEVQHSLSL
mmetsp:Transcript_59371/g.86908  ORF Transcript_59371/g.86908 Transcript_59371/m.86908 type:complete len:85 (+) Transcript_59371:225-479(+)